MYFLFLFLHRFLMLPPNDPLLRSSPPHLVRCRAGDALLWDSRTVHCNTPPLRTVEKKKKKKTTRHPALEAGESALSPTLLDVRGSGEEGIGDPILEAREGDSAQCTATLLDVRGAREEGTCCPAREADEDGGGGGNSDSEGARGRESNTGGGREGGTRGVCDTNTGGEREGDTGGEREGDTRGGRDANTAGEREGDTGGGREGNTDGVRPGRLVAYASFSPRSRASEAVLLQRQRAFAQGQTCTHWPFELTCLQAPAAVGEVAVDQLAAPQEEHLRLVGLTRGQLE